VGECSPQKHIVLMVEGECPPQKHIFDLEINYSEQNGYLKISIGCVWGNDGRGGLLPSNHFRPL
jgi:hypothetical protein